MNIIIGSTDAIISDICQGFYYVVTSDARLCTDTADVEFIFNLPLSPHLFLKNSFQFIQIMCAEF